MAHIGKPFAERLKQAAIDSLPLHRDYPLIGWQSVQKQLLRACLRWHGVTGGPSCLRCRLGRVRNVGRSLLRPSCDVMLTDQA